MCVVSKASVKHVHFLFRPSSTRKLTNAYIHLERFYLPVQVYLPPVVA